MPNYKCYGCDYETNLYCDLKRHMERKKDYCYKDNNNSKYLPDEQIVLSLFPINTLSDNDISKFKNTKNLYRKNLLKLFKKMNGNYLNNKFCTSCNTSFDKVHEYRKHTILECFYNDVCTENNVICSNYINNSNNINSNNINSNNNVTNNIGTININNNIEFKLIPFDEKWDISDVTETDFGIRLLCTEILYSNLLIKILEKKQNLNVLCSSKSDIGYVYKNEDEKYVSMKLKDIVDKSMTKLSEHLLEINNVVRKSSLFGNSKNTNNKDFEKLANESEKTIINKINDYNTKQDVNNNVVKIMANIFNEKYDETVEVSKSIGINNLLINNNGY